jgi:ATP-dependent DNA helicase RecQ
MTATLIDPQDFLHRFGLTEFRAGQRAVIDAVFSGRDCLCIMPTGGGKSLCYQLPSIARPGVTFVVSPLIALMKDQVDSMKRQGIAATFINSSLTPSEQYERLREIQSGKFDLVYVAPERLRNERFLDAVSSVKIQMLAIDEAHCISQWGHDFRPDYQRLGRFRKRLGNPQTIALTATATQLVREDIAKCLELRDPATFVSGFSRSNLSLFVETPHGQSGKDQRMLEFLEKTPGCGIIYAATRKNCEKIVEYLQKNFKRPTGFYHAGLDQTQRRLIQEQFMSGEIPIIIATNAFGMGVDKPDLRFVLHYQLPGSLEAYYQEVGRAGRDGKESRCLLLFSLQDRYIQEFFIENNYPTREVVRTVYEYLLGQPNDPVELTLQEIKDDLGISIGTEGIATCQKLLEQAGVLERMDTKQNLASVRIDSDQPSLIDAVKREAKNARQVLSLIEPLVAERRHERVYFSMTWLMDRSGLKSDAVAKALRDLCKLDFFDYVPPFRGRAIHFRRRDLKFKDLEIDFTDLERRKQAEYDRLERVLSYCRASGCRQTDILQYFGDHEQQRCGKCDNCRKTSWEHSPVGDANAAGTLSSRPKLDGVPSVTSTKSELPPPIHDAELATIQVALSGAARTHGRIGKNLLCQMLVGSNAKKLASLRLNRIKTFGALQWLKSREVTVLLDSLLEARLLAQIELNKFRPTIEITTLGSEVMVGRAAPPLIQLPLTLVKKIQKHAPIRAPQRQSEMSGIEPTPTELSTEDRRVTRVEVPMPTVNCESRGDIEEVCAESSKFSAVSVGVPSITVESKMDGRGITGAAEVRATEIEEEIDGDNSETSDLGSESLPDYYWTWRMFVEGFSSSETASIRRLSAEDVMTHLEQAARNGLLVNPNWRPAR